MGADQGGLTWGGVGGSVQRLGSGDRDKTSQSASGGSCLRRTVRAAESSALSQREACARQPAWKGWINANEGVVVGLRLMLRRAGDLLRLDSASAAFHFGFLLPPPLPSPSPAMGVFLLRGERGTKARRHEGTKGSEFAPGALHLAASPQGRLPTNATPTRRRPYGRAAKQASGQQTLRALVPPCLSASPPAPCLPLPPANGRRGSLMAVPVASTRPGRNLARRANIGRLCAVLLRHGDSGSAFGVGRWAC